MDITQLAAQTGTSSAPKKSDAAISSDFETFLKLLTAQISNQDPMDPMKSEEFAVQLATFSGVEQQVKTNELLERMSQGNSGSDLAIYSSWIGQEAKAAMPVHFSGSPVTLDIPKPAEGTRHELMVRNAAGAEVHRTEISGDGGEVRWDGRLGGDGVVPEGSYRFEVESFEDGSRVATSGVASYGKVTEVRASQQGAILVFEGGVQVPASEATALRQGDDSA